MANDMGTEQVAERFLRIKGIKQPDKSAIAAESPQAHSEVVTEAYDLLVEKEDLNTIVTRRQRELMKPVPPGTTKRWPEVRKSLDEAKVKLEEQLKGTSTLSLEEKRRLFREGHIDQLVPQFNSETPLEVIRKAQTRVGEVDVRMDQIFQTPGAFEKFREDLSRQVRVRHQARDARNLDRFVEQTNLLALKLAREAQVQGRTLNSVERGIIQDNKVLKQDALAKKQKLLNDPEVFDRLRLLELQEYKQQLARDRFVVTPSRKAYLEKIEQYWAEGKKVLLTGETGTGKTETIKRASQALFGVNPESVTGHQDMSIYELLGKTGFRVQEGDVFRPAPLVRAMTAREGRGQPFLFDEIDRAPTQSVMGIKTILNVRPGEKGVKIQTDSNGSFDVGKDYAVSGTANIKSEKYTTATELDPAIVRVFDAPMDIDYMPPSEVYDLVLSSLMDKRGGIPLSDADARTVLKNLCDAASWIQDAYQGRKVITDPSGKFLAEKGQATTGKAATLKKALLDPGRTLDMLKGWSSAQIKGEDFEDYLSQRILEFINNRAYPEEDRYYLAEIFALKGFLKNRTAGELMVTGLTQQVLDTWSGSTGKRAAKAGVSYLPYDRVVKLDPYRKLKRLVSTEAEDLLQEESIEAVTSSNKRERSVDSLNEEERRRIEEMEKENWERILGGKIEVKPYPKFITYEIENNFRRLGMEVLYVPGLDIGNLADLKKMGEEKFLQQLERKYPKWRRFESLSNAEKADHSIHRNLEKSYWEMVKNGQVDFPKLTGAWMAVETMPKPSYGTPYKESEITKMLRLKDRFDTTWTGATSSIKDEKAKILAEAGLPDTLDVRLLETSEWNLLGNHQKWGETNTYEWTNTEARGSGGSSRLIVGYSADGGAADVGWDYPGGSGGNIGFRIAVVLES